MEEKALVKRNQRLEPSDIYNINGYIYIYIYIYVYIVYIFLFMYRYVQYEFQQKARSARFGNVYVEVPLHADNTF